MLGSLVGCCCCFEAAKKTFLVPFSRDAKEPVFAWTCVVGRGRFCKAYSFVADRSKVPSKTVALVFFFLMLFVWISMEPCGRCSLVSNDKAVRQSGRFVVVVVVALGGSEKKRRKDLVVGGRRAIEEEQ